MMPLNCLSYGFGPLHSSGQKSVQSLTVLSTNSVFFSGPYFAFAAVCLSDYLTALLHFPYYKDKYTVQTNFLTLVIRNISQNFIMIVAQ